MDTTCSVCSGFTVWPVVSLALVVAVMAMMPSQGRKEQSPLRACTVDEHRYIIAVRACTVDEHR
jgi:hypothetical protein